MHTKLHYNMQKLSLTKTKQKSLFYSEDENTPTPVSAKSPKKTGFQTDDSDCGTPITSITPSPKVTKESKFKPQQTPLFTTAAKQLLNNKHIHSDAELKQVLELNDKIKSHPFRNLIFGPQISEAAFLKHLTLTQRGLIYATKCLKGPSEEFINSKKVELPRDESKSRVLLLDLDETLIHSCQGQEVPQVRVNTIGFNVRPYVNYMLGTLAPVFSIYIFTASSAPYAMTIADYLDPEQNKILGIFTRNHCMETKNGFFIKDLRTLKDVDLRKTLIVDNLSHSFGLQIDNGIPILEWHSDSKDQELKYLTDYLLKASQSDDLRDFNKRELRLRQLIDFQL